MTCPDLKALLLGELSPAEMASARNHLETCASCAADCVDFDHLLAQLRTVPDENVPVRIRFVSDKIFEPGRWQRFWGAPTPLWAAVCAALLLSVSASLVSARLQLPVAPRASSGLTVAQVNALVDQRVQTAVTEASFTIDRQNQQRTRAMLAHFYRESRRDREQLVLAVDSAYRSVDQKLNQAVYAANEKMPVLGQ